MSRRTPRISRRLLESKEGWLRPRPGEDQTMPDMARLQDNYYECVSVEFGLLRIGPRLQRLTRASRPSRPSENDRQTTHRRTSGESRTGGASKGGRPHAPVASTHHDAEA